MRGGNSLKSFIVAGLIAGFVSGIVNTIFSISGVYALLSAAPLVFPVNIQTIVIHGITVGIIWGIMWSIFYEIFYDYVPAKGVKKGLIYGLIIWIIAPIHNAGVSAMYGYFRYAIPYAFATFFSICITYGILLGYLYKPTK